MVGVVPRAPPPSWEELEEETVVVVVEGGAGGCGLGVYHFMMSVLPLKVGPLFTTCHQIRGITLFYWAPLPHHTPTLLDPTPPGSPPCIVSVIPSY